MSVSATLQLERSILGALMANNPAFDDVAEILSTSDFSSRLHRQVFDIVQRLADQGEPFDATILSCTIPALAELVAMQQDTLAPGNAVHYARQLRERSGNMALERTGCQVSQLAQSDKPLAEKIDQAQALVQAITAGRTTGGAVHIKEAITEAVDLIDERFHSDDPFTGIPTGFIDLDNITLGLQPSDLIIIAGRPSMGKTTLAMNIAEHAAIKAQAPVVVFSMEMSRLQLTQRMLASLGRIDQTKIRTGKLDDYQWPKLTSAVSMLSDGPLYIDDTAALTPSDLRARARRLKREHDIGLIVVDYLQLMRCPGESRVQEITRISGSLKALAKELNVPVVALSQLSREVTKRPDKRPTIADLRDSGSIEQDADLILLIHRDEVFNKDSKRKGLADIIIGKNRNGPTSEVTLTFLGKHVRFENHTAVEDYSSDYQESMPKEWKGGFDYSGTEQ